jgi:hypothetical protein
MTKMTNTKNTTKPPTIATIDIVGNSDDGYGFRCLVKIPGQVVTVGDGALVTGTWTATVRWAFDEVRKLVPANSRVTIIDGCDGAWSRGRRLGRDAYVADFDLKNPPHYGDAIRWRKLPGSAKAKAVKS